MITEWIASPYVLALPLLNLMLTTICVLVIIRQERRIIRRLNELADRLDRLEPKTPGLAKESNA